ncbi:MAG: hypothetical protein HY075_00180, partial [Deltaproteobacteria bacterium]|nr:hypothetical protein [Deltaproteobacteria bacterium]
RRFVAAAESSVGTALGLGHVARFEGGASGDLAGELRAWLAERLRSGARKFVVAGGDGTVNLALSTYVSLRDEGHPSNAVFGAVGLGSSNDFQKPFDSDKRARLAGFACRLDFNEAFAHDVGTLVIDGEKRARHFFVNASMGVTAEANDRFNRGGPGLRAMKRVWVDGAILGAALSTFAGYENRAIRLALDGENPVELQLTNLGVIKNRHFSGSFRYDTGPAPDDGMLGVRICRDMSRVEMLGTLGSLAQGRFSGLSKRSGRDAKDVRVESATGTKLAVETDGEVVLATGCRFGVRQKEIMLCP